MGCHGGGLVLRSAWHVRCDSASFTHLPLMWTTLHPLNLCKNSFYGCDGVKSQKNAIWKSWSGNSNKTVAGSDPVCSKCTESYLTRVEKSVSCTPLPNTAFKFVCHCKGIDDKPLRRKVFSPSQSYKFRFRKTQIVGGLKFHICKFEYSERNRSKLKHTFQPTLTFHRKICESFLRKRPSAVYCSSF